MLDLESSRVEHQFAMTSPAPPNFGYIAPHPSGCA
jgi:hypothetical protein